MSCQPEAQQSRLERAAAVDGTLNRGGVFGDAIAFRPVPRHIIREEPTPETRDEEPDASRNQRSFVGSSIMP